MKIVFCLLLLLAATGVGSQTGTPANLEEARVMDLENAWNQAVQLKDAKALAPLFVDESVYIDYDGSLMNKAQYLGRVIAPAVHPEHIVSEGMRAHSYGKSIVVTGIYREKGTRNGKPYARRDRFLDTWIQRNGAWVCVASQSTPISP